MALVSTFAALFIGEVMGMTLCLLCWYQRILMFPLAHVLRERTQAAQVRP